MIGEWGYSTPATWYFKPQSCHFISFALQLLSVELNTLGTAVNALSANPACRSTSADWLNMTRWPTRLPCRYQPFRLMQHRMELGCLIFYALDCYAAHTSPWDCVARAWSVLAVWSKFFSLEDIGESWIVSSFLFIQCEIHEKSAGPRRWTW